MPRSGQAFTLTLEYDSEIYEGALEREVRFSDLTIQERVGAGEPGVGPPSSPSSPSDDTPRCERPGGGIVRCLARFRASFSPSSSRGTIITHLRLMHACFLMPAHARAAVYSPTPLTQSLPMKTGRLTKCPRLRLTVVCSALQLQIVQTWHRHYTNIAPECILWTRLWRSSQSVLGMLAEAQDEGDLWRPAICYFHHVA